MKLILNLGENMNNTEKLIKKEYSIDDSIIEIETEQFEQLPARAAEHHARNGRERHGHAGERLDGVSHDIYRLAGEEFNIKSPKQLGPILFEKLGLPAGKKTKTGYSTSADVLEKIADKHEIIPLILEYRQLTKLQGTYIDGMIPLIHEDGKIHARFNQTVAATGRISSNEPNLQNIPVRQELGRSIRKAFGIF